MRYSLDSELSYPKAKELVEKLREVNISANITCGGISIGAEENNLQKMFDICETYGVKPHEGLTTRQSDVIHTVI